VCSIKNNDRWVRVTAFDYVRPDSLDEAIGLLDRHGPSARLLAGGTDVLVRLRLGHMRPSIVVDLKRARGLESTIVQVGSSLRVGARCVMADLLDDERIRKHFPALVEAAKVVGSVQIRHRATLVGNICNASPAADTAPALLVYDAAVNIVGPSGARRVPVADFFTGPGTTVLTRGELVRSIDLPIPENRLGAAFTRLTRRRGVDLASLTVACALRSSGEARVALGAVAPTPLAITDDGVLAAEVTRHSGLTEATLDRLVSRASPISDVRASRDYRSAMLRVFIKRTVALAAERLDGHSAQRKKRGKEREG
jgi:carbon-monoxide dehydrogenase medium subunit